MWVLVPMTPCTLLSRPAITSLSCSCSRTRTMAMRSASPATEYTSDTPSSSAMAWATSGMRSTSALTRTMAVITRPLYRRRPGGWLGRRDEPRDGAACHGVGLEGCAGTTRAAHRARPLPVEVDEADPGSLQPAQDLLRLLGNGGRRRPGGGEHHLRAGTGGLDVGHGVGTSRRDGAGG